LRRSKSCSFAPHLGIHVGGGLIAGIVSATIAAIMLLLVIRLVASAPPSQALAPPPLSVSFWEQIQSVTASDLQTNEVRWIQKQTNAPLFGKSACAKRGTS
jgi:hypothetical protein